MKRDTTMKIKQITTEQENGDEAVVVDQFTVNVIDVADIQLEFFLKLVKAVQGGDCTAFAPKPKAAEQFEAERVVATKNTVWVSGCNSWYLDDRGVPAAWPWSMQRFRSVLFEPNLDDFELTG